METMRKTILATYDLQIFSPEPEGDVPKLTEMDKRVLADLPARLEVMEELLEQTFPEGYQVLIREWSH